MSQQVVPFAIGWYITRDHKNVNMSLEIADRLLFGNTLKTAYLAVRVTSASPPPIDVNKCISNIAQTH